MGMGNLLEGTGRTTDPPLFTSCIYLILLIYIYREREGAPFEWVECEVRPASGST